MTETGAGFRPIPEAKGLAAEFLAGVAEGRLKLQKCGACANVWHYPRPFCPSCGARIFGWIDAGGRGTVHSFTIVHRAPTRELQADAPYVIALIDLEEGARVMSLIAGDDALGARVGEAVRIAFPAGPAGEPGMPVFRRLAP